MPKRLNTEEFISLCREVRGDKYDYSKVEYINNKQKVFIICKSHGIFNQTPNNHLSKKQDCPKCSDFYFEKLSTEQFILNSRKVHGLKYDYSLAKYVGNKIDVQIICKKHGIFNQTPNNHISKEHVCPKCSNKFRDTSTFIEKSNKVHNFKYDYSIDKYKNCRTLIKIKCKDHGIFEQLPGSHLQGNGCPVCCESKGERKISNYLLKSNIKYIPQYKFKDCKNIYPLSFDFYLPNFNTCIEYNGEQHFTSIEYFGGDIDFEKRKKRDEIKKEFCINNKIDLINIKYNENIEEKLNFLSE